MTSSETDWLLNHWTGTAGEFHSLDLDYRRSLWTCSVTQSALIVGSGQSFGDLDQESARARGLEVVRRRSGGGVVFVHPVDSLWVDLTIKRDDPLWCDDVSQSMLWLGDAFVQAINHMMDAETFRGSYQSGPIGRQVCFGSIAPGEVMAGTSKVVGISQRRTRNGARFQCVAYRQWNPDQWIDLVHTPEVQMHRNTLDVSTLDWDVVQLAEALQRVLAH